MRWMPSADDEQAQARGDAGGWRRNRLLVRGVLFVVTCLAVTFLFWLCDLLHAPKGIVTCAVSLAAAELLIVRYRFFHSGVEEGLWLGGTFAFIFGLPSEGRVEALLVFAAAAALSGWRVRNEVFGALAAVLVIAYAGEKWNGWSAMMVATPIAFAAATARQYVWQRRTTDRLFAAIALSAPLAGYIALINDASPSHIAAAAWMWIAAAALVFVGVRWRDRIVLISGAIAAGCGGYELRDILTLPVEAKLIVAGAILVAIAALLTRALRGRTAGFVLAPSGDDSLADAMQLAGTFVYAPHTDAPRDSGPHLDSAGPTDASFGGAGAGGGY